MEYCPFIRKECPSAVLKQKQTTLISTSDFFRFCTKSNQFMIEMRVCADKVTR